MTAQTKAAPIIIRLWVLRDGDWVEQECGGVDARFSMRCKLEAEGFKTKLAEVKPKKPVVRVTKQVWFDLRGPEHGWLMRSTEVAYNVFPDGICAPGGDWVTLASLPKKVQNVIKAGAPQGWASVHGVTSPKIEMVFVECRTPSGYFGANYRETELPAVYALLRKQGVTTVTLDETTEVTI